MHRQLTSIRVIMVGVAWCVALLSVALLLWQSVCIWGPRLGLGNGIALGCRALHTAAKAHSRVSAKVHKPALHDIRLRLADMSKSWSLKGVVVDAQGGRALLQQHGQQAHWYKVGDHLTSRVVLLSVHAQAVVVGVGAHQATWSLPASRDVDGV